MGGHKFAEFIPQGYTNNDIEEMALEYIGKYLDIREAPLNSHVSVQEQCIPQYLVGHAKNLSAMRKWIDEHADGNLSLIG